MKTKRAKRWVVSTKKFTSSKHAEFVKKALQAAGLAEDVAVIPQNSQYTKFLLRFENPGENKTPKVQKLISALANLYDEER